MKKIAVLLLVCLFLFTACTGKRADPQVGTLFALDTVVNYIVYGGDMGEYTSAELARYEELFSAKTEDSEIARVNSAGGRPVRVSDEVMELVLSALDISEKCEGSFDITVLPLVKAWGINSDNPRVPAPSELQQLLSLVDFRQVRAEGEQLQLTEGMGIDLGAIAKGYIAQSIIEGWQKQGIASGLISVGGNVHVTGPKPDGSPWVVGIQDPFKPGEPTAFIGVVSMESGAAVTAGDYRRFSDIDGQIYHHIIDPKTGYPAQSGLKSVTVFCEDGARADALSTALFVMGEQGAYDFHGKYGGFEYLLVTENGDIVASEGADGFFTPDEEYARLYRVHS